MEKPIIVITITYKSMAPYAISSINYWSTTINFIFQQLHPLRLIIPSF